MITVDSSNRVYFSGCLKDKTKFDAVIQALNSSRSLGLHPLRWLISSKPLWWGVPFGGLKQLLAMDPKDQGNLKQPGIPVMDSANNELVCGLGQPKQPLQGKR
ncbi:MAG: hypothetical protein IPQ06_07060 [Chitinophagaceae bacterium]|nr:hypothetical protein [Chitinophagaceae bacterium]